VSGPALVNVEGDEWLSRRKQMQPYFHRKHIAAMLGLMQSAIEQQFAVLDKLAATQTYVDIIPVLRKMTAQVFTQTFYGISLSESEAAAMSEAMYTLLSYVWTRYIAFSFVPEWMPYPNKKKFIAARTFLHETSRDLLNRRRKAGPGDDLLAMMMGMKAEAEGAAPFNDEQLLQETVSLFLGGFDTSSVTLGWVFYMLTQHHDVAQRLQDEVDTVLASGASIAESGQKFTYTHQIIQETMRLYPSAPGVPRLAIGDDQLGEYHIPAGATISVSFYAVHRHPDFWEAPNEFRPDRFAEADQKPYKHAFAYIPFSTGPRMCIGDQFALYEMRLTIAALTKRYRFTLDPTYQLEASTASTYFPSRLPLKIELR
jgi:cytochrome P450